MVRNTNRINMSKGEDMYVIVVYDVNAKRNNKMLKTCRRYYLMRIRKLYGKKL